jgi:fermentation-respiration switch protein FrsA (DUF1100 family)
MPVLHSLGIPGESRPRSRRRTLALLACGIFVPLALAPAALPAASLEAYGRLPRLDLITLSPDGSRVAFVRTEGDARVVSVVALATGQVVAKLPAGGEKLRGIEWADDARLLIKTSVTGVVHGFVYGSGGNLGEWFQCQVYDLTTGKLSTIPKPQSLGAELLLLNIIGSTAVRHVKDRTVLFVTGSQLGRGRADLWGGQVLLAVNLDTYAERLVTPLGAGTVRWAVDGDGEEVAEEKYDQKSGHWVISIRRDGRMQEAVSGTGLIEFPYILGLGPTADTLLVSNVENEESVWRLLSLRDGAMSAPMAERKTLERPIEDRVTHRMIGGVHYGDSAEYVFFDPAIEQSWQATVRAFPNEHVHFQSASNDFRKVIVRVQGDRDGYGYELVDLATHRAEALGDIYEGISKPFEVRSIAYAAGDGLMIPAYLTLPRGKPAQKLPLIVLPHDGPAARDTADFDWWSQALADQGYAVLQPNFRGSYLERAFLTKGFGEWGRKMQTDLSDGVHYLAREGVIDPARVCIVGRGSYGGYAALAGVALDPGVYRCAVSVAGLSDLRRWLSWMSVRQRSSGENLTRRYWDRFMGVSGPDDPGIEAISPLMHVDAIKVPVLLIHGKDDTVVPFEQSELMYEALRNAHQDVEIAPLKAEDHWLSRSATRLQMLQSSVTFLRAHNSPDP